MSNARLRDVLRTDTKGYLAWEVTVPISSNPFIMLEVAQLAFVGAAIVLVTMASGLWVIADGLQPGDLAAMLGIAGTCFAAFIVCFIVVSLLFFGNRYFAAFHCTPNGIHHSGMRGNDERGETVSLRMRPYPVTGGIIKGRGREKDLPWEKVDRFVDFPSMRSIQLKRGPWHMLRLYTPDEETHVRVVAYLSARFEGNRAG